MSLYHPSKKAALFSAVVLKSGHLQADHAISLLDAVNTPQVYLSDSLREFRSTIFLSEMARNFSL